MGLKPARKKSEVDAERAAKQAEQAAKARARETRERVKAVVQGRDDLRPVSREYTSTITGEKPLCHDDPIGPGRFTPERFLSDCSQVTADMLRKAWKKGDQLIARRVPVDGLPPVVIMSAFLRQFEVELVDDFDALIERFEEHISECAHPDKFFASCVAILHKRFLLPDETSFLSIKVPAIYEELF